MLVDQGYHHGPQVVFSCILRQFRKTMEQATVVEWVGCLV